MHLNDFLFIFYKNIIASKMTFNRIHLSPFNQFVDFLIGEISLCLVHFKEFVNDHNNHYYQPLALQFILLSSKASFLCVGIECRPGMDAPSKQAKLT